jgi:hypothetical protein
MSVMCSPKLNIDSATAAPLSAIFYYLQNYGHRKLIRLPPRIPSVFIYLFFSLALQPPLAPGLCFSVS